MSIASFVGKNGTGRRRVAFYLNAIWKPWWLLAVFVLQLVGHYDAVLGQFLPDDWSERLPSILTIINSFPWWIWATGGLTIIATAALESAFSQVDKLKEPDPFLEVEALEIESHRFGLSDSIKNYGVVLRLTPKVPMEISGIEWLWYKTDNFGVDPTWSKRVILSPNKKINFREDYQFNIGNPSKEVGEFVTRFRLMANGLEWYSNDIRMKNGKANLS